MKTGKAFLCQTPEELGPGMIPAMLKGPSVGSAGLAEWRWLTELICPVPLDPASSLACVAPCTTDPLPLTLAGLSKRCCEDSPSRHSFSFSVFNTTFSLHRRGQFGLLKSVARPRLGAKCCSPCEMFR